MSGEGRSPSAEIRAGFSGSTWGGEETRTVRTASVEAPFRNAWARIVKAPGRKGMLARYEPVR
ncbi:MAG: hypothetical protein A2902_01510 [Elusimicrobia bacterium RIFCSPLOWO2_01_FULL_64_13]|nr:MAG: hypothetical protein A2902_01510 [Elusimicrobia bacterium RIFCSPLOWO2_01_FULL_64_13]